ncbi:MAG: 4-(cytidine 5'-diphospho)-2-C-methyl-D-erythritol kinase, partial [Clostridia bacterium]|nr:4-(cytidine 5'-diphospho)-2-C-methyl-D-erythritol kinase [Clostridia bacterium]
LCEGIGEVLTKLPPMPDCYIVVARGGDGVSTPAAYGLLDKKWNRDFSSTDGDFDSIHSALLAGDLRALTTSMYNIFEDVILPTHNVASSLRGTMLSEGAVGAMMSGSGPSVFGVFGNLNEAVNASEKVSAIAKAFVCIPVREV